VADQPSAMPPSETTSSGEPRRRRRVTGHRVGLATVELADQPQLLGTQPLDRAVHLDSGRLHLVVEEDLEIPLAEAIDRVGRGRHMVIGRYGRPYGSALSAGCV